MYRNIEVRGQWVMDHFRRRWAYEQTEEPLLEFLAAVDGLTRPEARAILIGEKKFISKGLGYAIEDDDTVEIDGRILDWETA